MLGVADVDVGDYVDDSAVGFFGEAFVFAAVAGFHVEYRDMEAFGADDGEAGVGVAQDEDGVGADVDHEPVAAGDYVAHGFAEVAAYGVEVDFGVGEAEVAEEDAVKVVVVVLAGMGEDYVEVLAAFVDDGGETDYLGAGPDDYQQLEFAVVGKSDFILIGF